MHTSIAHFVYVIWAILFSLLRKNRLVLAHCTTDSMCSTVRNYQVDLFLVIFRDSSPFLCENVHLSVAASKDDVMDTNKTLFSWSMPANLKNSTHTHCKWTENAREHTKKPIVYMCKHVFVFVLLHSGRLRRFVQRSNVCLMFAHRARLCFFLSALLHFSFRRVGCEHFFHSRTKDSVRSYHSLSHRCTCQLKSVIIGRQPNPVHFRLWKIWQMKVKNCCTLIRSWCNRLRCKFNAIDRKCSRSNSVKQTVGMGQTIGGLMHTHTPHNSFDLLTPCLGRLMKQWFVNANRFCVFIWLKFHWSFGCLQKRHSVTNSTIYERRNFRSTYRIRINCLFIAKKVRRKHQALGIQCTFFLHSAPISFLTSFSHHTIGFVDLVNFTELLFHGQNKIQSSFGILPKCIFRS